MEGHCLREAGAGGSNPLTPTNDINNLAKSLGQHFCDCAYLLNLYSLLRNKKEGVVLDGAIHLHHPHNKFVFHAHPSQAIAATGFKDGIPFIIQDSSMLYGEV